MRIGFFNGTAMNNRKKLRLAAACALGIALIALLAIDRHQSTRAALRAQCESDAALGSRHVLLWQTATDGRPLAETLQRHISDPDQLGFSPAGKRMLQYLAAHMTQWANFRSDAPEAYKPILFAACLTAN
jgi:hypothetical protein